MTTDPLLKSVWRLKDIHAYTGLHRDTVLRAVERGELEGRQVLRRRGSPWLFQKEDVLHWWNTRRFHVAC